MDFFQLETFMEGEFIMQEGEIGDKLLFLHRGRVDVLVGPSMVKVATLGNGTVFGEMALLGAPKRNATIRASEFCDCRSLDKHTFQRLLRKFPEERAAFEVMAKERMEALMEVKEKDVSYFRSSARRQSLSKEREEAPTLVKSNEDSNRALSARRRSILPHRVEEHRGRHHSQSKRAATLKSLSSRSSSMSRSHAASPHFKTELPSLSSSTNPSRTSTDHSLPSLADCSTDACSDSDDLIQVRCDRKVGSKAGYQKLHGPQIELLDCDSVPKKVLSCPHDEAPISTPPFFKAKLASNSLASPKSEKCTPLHSSTMYNLNHPTPIPNSRTPMHQKELASQKCLLFDHMATKFVWYMPDLQFTVL
jgi:CRP-like cAMP-binding protein